MDPYYYTAPELEPVALVLVLLPAENCRHECRRNYADRDDGTANSNDSRMNQNEAMDAEPGYRAVGCLRALLFVTCALLSPTSFAFKVGDNYAQVVAEKGEPQGRMGAGELVVLRYSDCTVKLKDGVVIAITRTGAAKTASSTPTPEAKTPQQRAAALQAEEHKAVRRVIEIVNQPLQQYPITRGMSVARYPIWFHPGAETPDFDNVDITTFEDDKNYTGIGYEYGTSDLCPGVAFRLDDVGFNSKTKMFYVDRSVPKKRLTVEELQEINRLYRTIGRCNRELTALGVNPVIKIE